MGRAGGRPGAAPATVQFYISLATWRDTGCLFGYRTVTLREGGRLIDICGFLPIVWSPQRKALFWPRLFGDAVDPLDVSHAALELDVGYALDSACRGEGYATEAARALVARAVGELRARRIFSATSRDNVDSANVMRRIGMRVVSHPKWSEEEWPYWVGVTDF